MTLLIHEIQYLEREFLHAQNILCAEPENHEIHQTIRLLAQAINDRLHVLDDLMFDHHSGTRFHTRLRGHIPL